MVYTIALDPAARAALAWYLAVGEGLRAALRRVM
jgi:hypothetical protein